MRSLFKFSLLSLLSAVSLNAVVSHTALAAGTPNEVSGATSAGTYAPRQGLDPNIDPNQVLSSRIYNGLANRLDTIAQREAVMALNGQTLPISPNQIDNLASLFLRNDGGTSVNFIEQQLAAEVGDQFISLSPLGNTPGDLQRAINSANELILSLDSQQLEAASQSPTFLAILEMLEEGSEYLENNRFDRRFARDGFSDFSLIDMSLAEIVEIVPEPEVIQPQVEPTPPPRTEPEFQEPVRGLW